MRILVAEDDAILADGLTRTLRQSGYAVDWVKTGIEADSALDANDFDLLILDIGLPKKSGLEVLRRVRALTRRGMAGGPTLLKHGPLTYDQVGRSAQMNGDAIELSAREVSLLEIFLQRAGRLVSKDQLVGHLCEWGEEVSGNAIEVYVHRLRKKLEPGGVRIVTVRGLGYSVEKTSA